MPLAPKTKTKRKVPVHHKKRTAAHHKQTKHYVKAYWPYLPMLLVTLVGVIVNNIWSVQSGILGVQQSLTSQSLLDSTNRQRTSNDRGTLTIDTRLTQAAQAKAVDMVQKGYWAHNSPGGRAPWNFIADSGYGYSVAGENLAYGFNTADATLTAWMNSPEHRANVLSDQYRNVGFGIVNAQNFQGKPATTVVVAMYGAPGTGAPEITFTVPDDAGVASAVPEPGVRPVSRLAVISGGQAGIATFTVTALTSVAVIVFLLRNGFRVQRFISNGEHFIVKHPVLDIAVVTVITLGVVLTRSSGAIR